MLLPTAPLAACDLRLCLLLHPLLRLLLRLLRRLLLRRSLHLLLLRSLLLLRHTRHGQHTRLLLLILRHRCLLLRLWHRRLLLLHRHPPRHLWLLLMMSGGRLPGRCWYLLMERWASTTTNSTAKLAHPSATATSCWPPLLGAPTLLLSGLSTT